MKMRIVHGCYSSGLTDTVKNMGQQTDVLGSKPGNGPAPGVDIGSMLKRQTVEVIASRMLCPSEEHKHEPTSRISDS